MGKPKPVDVETAVFSNDGGVVLAYLGDLEVKVTGAPEELSVWDPIVVRHREGEDTAKYVGPADAEQVEVVEEVKSPLYLFMVNFQTPGISYDTKSYLNATPALEMAEGGALDYLILRSNGNHFVGRERTQIRGEIEGLSQRRRPLELRYLIRGEQITRYSTQKLARHFDATTPIPHELFHEYGDLLSRFTGHSKFSPYERSMPLLEIAVLRAP